MTYLSRVLTTQDNKSNLPTLSRSLSLCLSLSPVYYCLLKGRADNPPLFYIVVTDN